MGCGGSKQQVDTRASTPQPRSRPASAKSSRSVRSARSNRSNKPATETAPVKPEQGPTNDDDDQVRNARTPTPPQEVPSDEGDDALEEAVRPKTAEELNSERPASAKGEDDLEDILPDDDVKSRNEDWIQPSPGKWSDEDEVERTEQVTTGDGDETLPPRVGSGGYNGSRLGSGKENGGSRLGSGKEDGGSRQESQHIEDFIVPEQEARLGDGEETLPPQVMDDGYGSPSLETEERTVAGEGEGEGALPNGEVESEHDMEGQGNQEEAGEGAPERNDPESGEGVGATGGVEAESNQESVEEGGGSEEKQEEGAANEDIEQGDEPVAREGVSMETNEGVEEGVNPESGEEVAVGNHVDVENDAGAANGEDGEPEITANEDTTVENVAGEEVTGEEEIQQLAPEFPQAENDGSANGSEQTEAITDQSANAGDDGAVGDEAPAGDEEGENIDQENGEEQNGQEPVSSEQAQDNEVEPVSFETAPDNDQEPVNSETAEENAQEPISSETAEENAQEPVNSETAEDNDQEPVNSETAEENAQEPVRSETALDNDSEPVNSETAEDNGQEPTAAGNAGESSPEQNVTTDTGEEKEVNTYSPGIPLPKEQPIGVSDGVDSVYGFARSTWPVRCYVDLTEFNVNASYGGCASLVLISCSYNKAESSTTEVILVRSGFDRNHYQPTSLIKFHAGHFGAANGLETDEDGKLIANCLFGHNYVSMLSNDPKYGSALYGEAFQTGGDESFEIPFNVNGGNGGGTSLICCSGELPGVGDTDVVSAVYVLRSGVDSDIYQVKKLSEHGTDSWKFAVAGGGRLQIIGPRHSKVALFHNRTDAGVQNDPDIPKAKVVHRQAHRGDDETVLLHNLPNHALVLVLCSSSAGTEDKTTAALYMVTVSSSGAGSVDVKTEFVQGSTKSAESPDSWTFSGKSGTLVATGPPNPCRYGVICNTPMDDEEKGEFGCLATGSSQPIGSSVAIDGETITGWVSERTRILMTANGKQIGMFNEEQLVDVGDERFAFQRRWKDEEKEPGLNMVRVFAIQSDKEKEDKLVELRGSPYPLVRQPDGVIFAINCGGPTYQAINNTVYENEHKYFKNYGLESQSRAFGGIKYPASVYHLLTNTHDGFLHRSARSTGVEADQEKKVIYEVPDIPDGLYKLRLHFASLQKSTLAVQGEDRSGEVFSQLKATKEVTPGHTTCQATIPVVIGGGALNLKMNGGMVCGFALMKDSYEDPKSDDSYIQWEQQEKQKLADSADPLPRSMTRKKLKIAGWSPNLLQNASGEAGDMSLWNHGGDWKIQEGGYGTEKAFVTSHMWCTKYQAVDLREHFSDEYLDSAPDIQVFEWYHEGVGGGGFYKFEATLLDADGDVLKSYSSGQIGTIYTGKWDKQGVTFTDYGPGVRGVGLQSAGKDDKHWGGHYGAMCAAASVRVKRETATAVDDSYQDLDLGGRDVTSNDKVVLQVLSDNADVVAEFADDGDAVVDDRVALTSHIVVGRKKEKKKKRKIRVFVSSTFRDFQREREHLIKKTFSQLNRLCADLHVFFTYVDLRWGITTEQTHSNRTIDICLKEVDRCRPYFVCMMGDRYGWCQKEDEKDELLDGSFDYAIDNNRQFEWIQGYRYGTSITKLEVLHGALLHPEAAKDRAFFYLRESPETLDYLADPDDIKVCMSESDWHHEQQYELREMVRNSKLNHRTYTTPEEVCNLIKEDLERCVLEDFPVESDLTVLEREREAHQAFAEARRRVYIGRQEYFHQIDSFMTDDQNMPLVILGESGSGKSALVANWVGRFEDEHPDAFVFVHFIGSSAETASHVKLLRRLLEELKTFFGFEMAIPRSDTNVIRDFPTWLRLAASRGKVVIVLDALNQLDSGAGVGEEQDLRWIPRPLPRNVYMLLSTLPGRSFDAVTLAGWPTFTVSALQPSEKETIISEYLEGIYGKTLTADQKQMIVDAPQSNNPLYLRALLDELRVFGRFEILSDRIKQLLTAEDPSVLFGKILERLEGDFEGGQYGRKGLVRDSTVAIWCAHRGMSEEELTSMLDVPSAVWSPFYISLEENLINRNGILNFFHDHLRQAVEARYLPTQEDKRREYSSLANFFDNRTIDDRVVDELPFLWAQAGEMDKLRSTITDLDVFNRLMKTEEGKFDLVKSWKTLGDYSQVEPSYLDSLEKRKGDPVLSGDSLTITLQYLAEFFMELGLLNSARSLFEKLLVELEASSLESHGTVVYDSARFSRRFRSKHPHVIDVMHKLGKVCEKQMNVDEAKRYFSDALDRQNRIVTPEQKLQSVEGLLGLGSVLGLQDQPGEAKKVFLRAKEVAIDALGPTHHYVASIIGQVGKLCYQQGRVDEALGYYLQDLKLTRSQVGTNHPRTAGIINSIALVYDDKNDELAGTLYEVALAILLETYGPAHLDVAHVRHNLGAFYFATDRFARAKYQLEEAIKIYEAFQDTDQPDAMLEETRQALDDVIAFSK